MSFKEVAPTPLPSEISSMKRKYRKAEKTFEDKKYQFLEAIKHDDWEVLTSSDFLEVKEAYLERKRLYWKIHALENPKDTATREAYNFLNSMNHNDQFDFLMKNGLTTHRLIDAIRENPNFLHEVEV